MKTPRFTVAVIAHQTEPYLMQALDSVSAQTFPDFECLMIVEESTDRSLEICRRKETADPRFKTAALPKSGSASVSRNYAMDHAAGKYLAFLDGDDLLKPEMLERAAALLEKHPESDVLHFNGEEILEQPDGSLQPGRPLANLPSSESGNSMTGPDLIRKMGNGGAVGGYTWLNICRTAFLRENKLYQNPGLLMEDFEWTPRCWFLAKHTLYLAESLYIYRRRPESVTTKNSARILHDLGAEFAFVPEFLKKHNVPQDIRRIWANKWISIFIWFFFYPKNNRKYPMRDRRAVRAMLLGSGTNAVFREFARLSSKPKRIGMTLFALPGGLLPAMLYFQLFYFPLLKVRRDS